jgi:hypothetical protein
VAGIFLSYRREDAGGHAGRLYDKLADRFGSELVFRDIDTLRPGSVFVEYIDASIANADVVIAMIGRDWLSATDAEGHRRLADPNDYVRFEIETALRRNVRVIPVLVRNAVMPRADELPDELSPLAQRHAFELPDQHWPFATDALLAAIEDIAPALAKPSPGPRSSATISTQRAMHSSRIYTPGPEIKLLTWRFDFPQKLQRSSSCRFTESA